MGVKVKDVGQHTYDTFPYRHYRKITSWYSDILSQHFPEVSFEIHPDYCARGDSYRPKVDKLFIEAPDKHFNIADQDSRVGKIATVFEAGMSIPRIKAIEEVVEVVATDQFDKVVQESRIRQEAFEKSLKVMKRKFQFLVDRGYRPAEIIYGDRCTYDIEGDGSQERVAQIIRDFVEVGSI